MAQFLAFFAIILFVSSLTSLVRASKYGLERIKSNQGETTYGVIVDCGSSGTRVHIYEWDTSLGFPDLLHKIEPMRDPSDASKAVSMKIRPGLSSLKNNPSRASNYMQPVINFIYEKIPKKSYKSTSIYMMATAGMRLLDDRTQRKILEDIANDLRYTHEFAKVRISIITGAHEGMYQWITVNSKLQRFAPRETNTIGVIEMGGCSVQVTYQLKLETFHGIMDKLNAEEKFAFSHQIVEPELSREAVGYPYKLVSVTFLGLGSNSAREAYIDLLIRNKLDRHEFLNRILFRKQPFLNPKKPIILKDPCLPEGAEEKIERPRKMLDPAHNRYQTVGFNIEAGDEVFPVIIVGESNYFICQFKVGQLLMRIKDEKLNCKPQEPCTMSLLRSKFVPYDHEEFVGLSEFYYTINAMLNVKGRYDRVELFKKTYVICSKNYRELKRMFPDSDKEDPDRIKNACFKAVWIETFLTDGLKMPIGYQKFTTVGKINSDEIDWTLGAVLDKSLAIERAAEAS